MNPANNAKHHNPVPLHCPLTPLFNTFFHDKFPLVLYFKLDNFFSISSNLLEYSRFFLFTLSSKKINQNPKTTIKKHVIMLSVVFVVCQK